MGSVSAKKVVLTSFLVDILDIILNFLVALITGSVVMISEGLQGAAGLLATGFLLIGLKRSQLKADKTHPFGYGRELYFWTLLSSVLILTVISGLSFYFGLMRFLHPETIDNIYLAYIALIVATITNSYSLSLGVTRLMQGHHWKKVMARFLQSSRVETKTAIILDLMGATTAIVGLISLIIYGFTGLLIFDGLGAMVIGVAVGILAIFLLVSVKDYLVGVSAPLETQKQIIAKALEIKEVHDVLDLKTLHLGPGKLLVNMEVHLKDNLNTDQIESIMDLIKDKVKKDLPNVHHIQIELETPSKKPRHD